MKEGNTITHDTLDGIFNGSQIKIKGKRQPLRFTFDADFWLEQEGISMAKMHELLASKPLDVSLKLAFAGLPAEKYREAISYEEFLKMLSGEEKREIVKRVDIIMGAYYRDLLATIEKHKTALEEREKQDEEGKKKA